MVLSKMDASYRQMRNEALLMLQYDRLKKEVPQNITTAEVSATTAEGLNTVISWLKEKWRPRSWWNYNVKPIGIYYKEIRYLSPE